MRKLFNIQSDYAVLIAEATKCYEFVGLKRGAFCNRDLGYLFGEIAYLVTLK